MSRPSLGPTRSGRRTRALLLAALALLSAACAQRMASQPRYDPLEPSAFFADGQSARPLVADTVARGQLQSDELLFTGRQNGNLATEFPFPVTRDLLERGQERYNVFCAPCHGLAGNGDGLVVRRGFTPPPSLHSDRLRQVPPGYIFAIITAGFGAMPSYADQVPPRDRWAIIAYVRALQLSQNAPVDELPPEIRRQLEELGGQP